MAEADSDWQAKHPETPPQFKNLHRFLMVAAAIFFAWLVIEAAIVFPLLIVRYGGQ
jgi:hypothetical protein